MHVTNSLARKKIIGLINMSHHWNKVWWCKIAVCLLLIFQLEQASDLEVFLIKLQENLQEFKERKHAFITLHLWDMMKWSLLKLNLI